MLELIIKEEVFGTGNTNELSIQLTSECITLAELIQQKVAAKVKQINIDFNKNEGTISSFLLTKEEKALNKHAVKKGMQRNTGDGHYDEERKGYEALAAFQRNAFFVIIDGKQREDLKEALLLSKSSEVLFIKLMPLVGG